MRLKKRPAYAEEYYTGEGLSADEEDTEGGHAAYGVARKLTKTSAWFGGNEGSPSDIKIKPLFNSPAIRVAAQQRKKGRPKAFSAALHPFIVVPRHFLDSAFPDVEHKYVVFDSVVFKNDGEVQGVDGACTVSHYFSPSRTVAPDHFAALNIDTHAADIIDGCLLKQVKAKPPNLLKVYVSSDSRNQQLVECRSKGNSTTASPACQAPPLTAAEVEAAIAQAAATFAKSAPLQPLPALQEFELPMSQQQMAALRVKEPAAASSASLAVMGASPQPLLAQAEPSMSRPCILTCDDTRAAAGVVEASLCPQTQCEIVPLKAPAAEPDSIVVMDSDSGDDDSKQDDLRQQLKNSSKHCGYCCHQTCFDLRPQTTQLQQQQVGLTGCLKTECSDVKVDRQTVAADALPVTDTKHVSPADSAGGQLAVKMEPAVKLEQTDAAVDTGADKATPREQTPAAAKLPSSTAATPWSPTTAPAQAAPAAAAAVVDAPIVLVAAVAAASALAAGDAAAPAAPAISTLPAGFTLSDCNSDILSAGRQLTDLLDHLHAPDHQVMQLNDYIMSLSHQSGDDNRVVRFWYDYSQIRLWVRRRNRRQCREMIQQMLESHNK